MNTGISLKLQMVSLGLALAIISAGCAMIAPKGERYVAAPLGSTWTQVKRESGSYGSKNAREQWRRGERMWQGRQVLTFEGPQFTILAELDGTWIGFFKGDTPILSFNKASWQWPLNVGKTWTRDRTITFHAKKQTIPYQQTYKVEAYEDVTVPAGTFKTFKVRISSTLGQENVVWFEPKVGIFVKQINTRTAKHRAGPGTQEIEIASLTIAK